VSALREHTSGHALRSRYGDIEPLHLQGVFAADPCRGERLVAAAAGR
jgi:hypothetical protein